MVFKILALGFLGMILLIFGTVFCVYIYDKFFDNSDKKFQIECKKQEEKENALFRINPKMKDDVMFHYNILVMGWFAYKYEQDTYKKSLFALKIITEELYVRKHDYFFYSKNLKKSALFDEIPYFTIDFYLEVIDYIIDTGNDYKILQYISQNGKSEYVKDEADSLLSELG